MLVLQIDFILMLPDYILLALFVQYRGITPPGSTWRSHSMVLSILVLSWFWISAAVASPIAVVFIVLDALGLGRLARPALGAVTRGWSRGLLWMMGVKTHVDGLENVPDEERLCFIANHQGDLDIIMMVAYMPRPVGFIAKSQAAWFPFVNLWGVALGSAFIVRNNPRRGKKAIDRGVRNIQRGHALAIYPEGTRSRGPAMLPFKNGSFKLATLAGATIVPVTIDGTYKAWEERMRISPADVRIVVHQPIRTSGMDAEARRALPERVRAVIASALARE
jgi:1-acyl-sn-glycerol-3-phosphate acyltransferase